MHTAETASPGELQTQLKEFMAEAANSNDVETRGGFIPANRRFFLEENRAPDYSRSYLFARAHFARDLLDVIKTTSKTAALERLRKYTADKIYPNIHR